MTPAAIIFRIIIISIVANLSLEIEESCQISKWLEDIKKLVDKETLTPRQKAELSTVHEQPKKGKELVPCSRLQRSHKLIVGSDQFDKTRYVDSKKNEKKSVEQKMDDKLNRDNDGKIIKGDVSKSIVNEIAKKAKNDEISILENEAVEEQNMTILGDSIADTKEDKEIKANVYVNEKAPSKKTETLERTVDSKKDNINDETLWGGASISNSDDSIVAIPGDDITEMNTDTSDVKVNVKKIEKTVVRNMRSDDEIEEKNDERGNSNNVTKESIMLDTEGSSVSKKGDRDNLLVKESEEEEKEGSNENVIISSKNNVKEIQINDESSVGKNKEKEITGSENETLDVKISNGEDESKISKLPKTVDGKERRKTVNSNDKVNKKLKIKKLKEKVSESEIQKKKLATKISDSDNNTTEDTFNKFKESNASKTEDENKNSAFEMKIEIESQVVNNDDEIVSNITRESDTDKINDNNEIEALKSNEIIETVLINKSDKDQRKENSKKDKKKDNESMANGKYENKKPPGDENRMKKDDEKRIGKNRKPSTKHDQNYTREDVDEIMSKEDDTKTIKVAFTKESSKTKIVNEDEDDNEYENETDTNTDDETRTNEESVKIPKENIESNTKDDNEKIWENIVNQSNDDNQNQTITETDEDYESKTPNDDKNVIMANDENKIKVDFENHEKEQSDKKLKKYNNKKTKNKIDREVSVEYKEKTGKMIKRQTKISVDRRAEDDISIKLSERDNKIVKGDKIEGDKIPKRDYRKKIKDGIEKENNATKSTYEDNGNNRKNISKQAKKDDNEKVTEESQHEININTDDVDNINGDNVIQSQYNDENITTEYAENRKDRVKIRDEYDKVKKISIEKKSTKEEVNDEDVTENSEEDDENEMKSLDAKEEIKEIPEEDVKSRMKIDKETFTETEGNNTHIPETEILDKSKDEKYAIKNDKKTKKTLKIAGKDKSKNKNDIENVNNNVLVNDKAKDKEKNDEKIKIIENTENIKENITDQGKLLKRMVDKHDNEVETEEELSSTKDDNNNGKEIIKNIEVNADLNENEVKVLKRKEAALSDIVSDEKIVLITENVKNEMNIVEPEVRTILNRSEDVNKVEVMEEHEKQDKFLILEASLKKLFNESQDLLSKTKLSQKYQSDYVNLRLLNLERRIRYYRKIYLQDSKRKKLIFDLKKRIQRIELKMTRLYGTISNMDARCNAIKLNSSVIVRQDIVRAAIEFTNYKEEIMTTVNKTIRDRASSLGQETFTKVIRHLSKYQVDSGIGTLNDLLFNYESEKCRFMKSVQIPICCSNIYVAESKKKTRVEDTSLKDCSSVQNVRIISTILPLGHSKFKAKLLCRKKSVVMLQRTSGYVNFTRNWNDYKYGFGELNDSFWIGLEVLYQLTREESYRLLVELKDWDNNTYNGTYEHFKVDSEREGYQLNIGNYHGDCGDGLSAHDNSKFSTFDVDNDHAEVKFGGSCSNRFRGGWWYYSCYKCNPTGVYYDHGKVDTERFDGISWKPLRPPTYSFRQIVMSIQRIQ